MEEARQTGQNALLKTTREHGEAGEYESTVDTDVPWHVPLPELSQDQIRVFKEYVGLQEDKIRSYLENYRNKVWLHNPYPFIGMFGFLKPVLKWAEINFEYNEVVQRVKQGATLLDVGCAMGHDLRWLATEGLPTDNLVATDLKPEFWNSSFEFFRDAERLQSDFIRSDILEPNSPLLRLMSGKVDIMVLGDFLHLFNWDESVDLICHLIKLGKSLKGTMIIGKNVGNRHGLDVRHGWTNSGTCFLHNEKTFQAMWQEVEQRTGTCWDIDVRMAELGVDPWWSPKEHWSFLPPDAVGIRFVCRRNE